MAILKARCRAIIDNKRIGIMGGTFNPIHSGHLQIAKSIADLYKLDEVLFIPSGNPPHKWYHVASKEHRLNMVKLAVECDARFSASAIEIDREGTTYTVDTVSDLHKQFPNIEIYFIVGADVFVEIESWRNIAEVLSNTKIIVAMRPKFDIAIVEEHTLGLKMKYDADIIITHINGPDISSTDVRDAVLLEFDSSSLLPKSVYNYIIDNRLYVCDEYIRRSELLGSLNKNLKPNRLTHTLGVEQVAIELAKLYRVDLKKAQIAALLHDCAKNLPLKKLQEIAIIENLELTDLQFSSDIVLHGLVGAILARDKYGIHDVGILNAIRRHTVGCPNMSKLDAIIYVADLIEPHREEFNGLNELRNLSKLSLYNATKAAFEVTIQYVNRNGFILHPESVQAYNWLRNNPEPWSQG